jgi:hypothetical protein
MVTMATRSTSNFSPSELKSYLSRGIIKIVQTQPIPRTVEETSEYKKFSKLKGKGIGIAEAARKYGVPHPTILNWRKRGYIPTLGKEGTQKILIDESYVAYCVEVYKRNPGQGKTIFNQDGTPFIPKTSRS